MLETAKLELFCTSISAPDKNVNLYHNLIIFLNKASTENPFGHSGFKQSMKSIQPWKQRVRNLGICHQSSLLALCLQQTASSSTVKYCQDTTPPQIPWWCIMIIQLTLERGFLSKKYISQFCTSHRQLNLWTWNCRHGGFLTAWRVGTLNLCALQGSGAVTNNPESLPKVKFNEYYSTKYMKLTANKNRGKLHCKL